jgi:glycosyltransferase involved in cell wall biosynthesis
MGALVCEPVDLVAPGLRPGVKTCPTPLSAVLLTGGQDPHYAVGLATALTDENVTLDVIGSDELDVPAFRENPRVRFLNLHGAQSSASRARKIGRVLSFYVRLAVFALNSKPTIFHILWNNRLQNVDRTLLMVLYRMLGKKVVVTAHNVNAGKRDGRDWWLNRATLRCQYALTDHIFVHTKRMQDELVEEFGIGAQKVTVIPYGVNNVIPYTGMTAEDARHHLGLKSSEKVLLYFGAIKTYKGLEYLVDAFQRIASQDEYRLIIAGERKKGHEEYWELIRQRIESHPSRGKILQKIAFIPDDQTEIYFKAADIAVLPYVDIFQSGILFMAYNYGLPVVATNVGSFSEDIEEGDTGYICKPRDAQDLAETIKRYFGSELYERLSFRRPLIRECVQSRHSWITVASITRDVYCELLEGHRTPGA